MTSGTTRLHISPFTPALLETVLNPSLRSSAADISFHTLETFPENSYGYVNLPTMEAEKLKKKLNGSILKGKKMKVEEAKPKKRHRVEEDTNSHSESKFEAAELKKSSKKRKGDKDALPGHELSPDRHVKRGWTEPGKRERHTHKSKTKESKSSSQRSKYTDNPECIFLTKPPANQAVVEKVEKKRSGTKGNEKDSVVVHEFAKTVKHPTFLRSGENVEEATLTDGFVEGKGWVSRGGDVKEAAREEEAKATKGAPGRVKGGKDKIKPIAKRPAKEPSPQESSSGNSSSESSSSATSSSEEDTDRTDADDDDSETTSTSSSEDTSSSSDDNEESADEETPGKLDKAKATSTLPILSSGTPIANPPEESTNGDGSVHPLEKLFKLPAPTTPKSAPRPSLEIQTQFSFFGGENGDDDDDDSNDVEGTPVTGLEPPQTPFTRQDLHTRGVRSAAPTPDTAAPQRISFWENNDNNNYGYDDEDDEEYYETPNAKKQKQDTNGGDAKSKGKGKITGADGGDFASWFWENRGENNRAWKKRRREAAKEKRQRENRRKGNKGK